jgi:hypothetical protein
MCYIGLKIYLSLLAILVASTRTGASAPPWQELFDGKSLAGWRANTAPETWAVQEGMLVATPQAVSSHLFFVGNVAPFEKYRNFELEAVVRGGAQANSGIFFHTALRTFPGTVRLSEGYEVQLCTKNDKRKTGSLYEIVDVREAPVRGDDWFVVRITVQGAHIVVRIDGTPVVDYVEPPDVASHRSELRKGRILSPSGGGIALQAHVGGGPFYFRNIRIRRLE